MYQDIREIRRIRKQHGLTQSQLASAAQVSQSLIAKIEAGTLDPTYSKAQQIFQAIESFSSKTMKTAKDIMQKKVISCKASDPVHTVISIMRKHSISQMPVMDERAVAGSISERNILNALADKASKDTKASSIMEESAPILPETTKSSVLIELLKNYPFVLISTNGKIAGIVTKSDVLKAYG